MKNIALIVAVVFGFIGAVAMHKAYDDPTVYGGAFVLAAGCVIGIGMVVAKVFLPSASLQAARLALYQDVLAVVQKLQDDGDADAKTVLSALSPFEWRIRLLAPTHVYEQFLLLYRCDDSAEALLENPLFADLIDQMGAEF